MGYYTAYVLNLPAENPLTEDGLTQMDEIVDAFQVFEEGSARDGYWYGYAKWYDYEQDMARLSKQFPDILFELHGNGEDQEDIWYAYFQDGKVQHCQAEIYFAPFDPKKLTEVPFKDGNG